MVIGYNRLDRENSYIGKLSGLNVWSYVVPQYEVIRMAYGCGNEAGDILRWMNVLTNGEISGNVNASRPATCKNAGGME